MSQFWKIGALALGVSMLFAVPVYADHHEEGETEEAAVESNPNDRICRRVHVTGSNIPQRICMSRAEWSDLREESQEELRDSNRDAGVNTRTVGGN